MSPDDVQVVKSRKPRWRAHIGTIVNPRNACRIWLEDLMLNVRLIFKEIGRYVFDGC